MNVERTISFHALPDEPVVVIRARHERLPWVLRQLATHLQRDIDAGRQPASEAYLIGQWRAAADAMEHWRHRRAGAWLPPLGTNPPPLPAASEISTIATVPLVHRVLTDAERIELQAALAQLRNTMPVMQVWPFNESAAPETETAIAAARGAKAEREREAIEKLLSFLKHNHPICRRLTAWADIAWAWWESFMESQRLFWGIDA